MVPFLHAANWLGGGLELDHGRSFTSKAKRRYQGAGKAGSRLRGITGD
jgi:hypothetical protein